MAAERRGLRAAGLAAVPRVISRPPVRRRDFWAVQVLVFAIAGTHTFVETVMRVEFPPELYLVPTSLFFIPVVYAAVRFGVRGSVTTALWSIVLTLPNVVVLHDGLTRLGIGWQLAILLAIAAFVGLRVERERRAREMAESRERSWRASEGHYRAIFDGAAEAFLVIGDDGRIQEANAAAGELLGIATASLVGLSLEQAVGDDVARALRQDARAVGAVALPAHRGRPTRWVQPVASEELPAPDGRTHVHAMLRDVTLQRERQQVLERYARQTVAAREEEQRRIGRELHDGPLQSLILVGRRLDTVAEGATDAATETHAREARQVVDEAAAELRQLSRSLRPSILDDLGLVAALRSEAGALARRTKIAVRYTAGDLTRRLAPEVELTLLRVTQEALHNVERHAGAARVSIRVGFDPSWVSLVIRDDGRGPTRIPSVADLLEQGKMGVVGMEERVRLVGGALTIRARPGRGTTIAARVPTLAPATPNPAATS